MSYLVSSWFRCRCSDAPIGCCAIRHRAVLCRAVLRTHTGIHNTTGITLCFVIMANDDMHDDDRTFYSSHYVQQ